MAVSISSLPTKDRPYTEVHETITITPGSSTVITNPTCTCVGDEPKLVISDPVYSGKSVVFTISGRYKEEFEDKIYFVDRGKATTVDANMNYTPRYPDVEQPPQIVYGFDEMPPKKDIFYVIEDTRTQITKTFRVTCTDTTTVVTTLPDGTSTSKKVVTEVSETTSQVIKNRIGTMGAQLKQYIADNAD